jgi:DNA-binding IclR family transcriptional regulator
MSKTSASSKPGSSKSGSTKPGLGDGRKKSASPRGIQSIEIGMTVLATLAASTGPLHLREVAAASRMSASKAYRYLVSLTDIGLVKQDPDTGQYDLGSFSCDIGYSILRRIRGIDVVADALAAVVNEIHRDVHTTIWTSSGPMVIRWLEGSPNLAIKVRAGVVLPVSTTATGRVWATHLAPQLTKPIIDAELLRLAKTEQTSKDALWELHNERISAVRRYGIARSQGERRTGVDALSGPILGTNGIAFAVTVMGSHRDFDLSYDGKPATALKNILEKASRALQRLDIGEVTAPLPDAKA